MNPFPAKCKSYSGAVHLFQNIRHFGYGIGITFGVYVFIIPLVSYAVGVCFDNRKSLRLKARFIPITEYFRIIIIQITTIGFDIYRNGSFFKRSKRYLLAVCQLNISSRRLSVASKLNALFSVRCVFKVIIYYLFGLKIRKNISRFFYLAIICNRIFCLMLCYFYVPYRNMTIGISYVIHHCLNRQHKIISSQKTIAKICVINGNGRLFPTVRITRIDYIAVFV